MRGMRERAGRMGRESRGPQVPSAVKEAVGRQGRPSLGPPPLGLAPTPGATCGHGVPVTEVLTVGGTEAGGRACVHLCGVFYSQGPHPGFSRVNVRRVRDGSGTPAPAPRTAANPDGPGPSVLTVLVPRSRL